MNTIIKPNTLFFDRLTSLRRTKANGEVVPRGGSENALRIIRGKRGYFVRVTCIMQEVLSANITQWPSDVSEDGLTITLWLFDQALGRQPTNRKFELTFLDEVGARRFFEALTEVALPEESRVGRSYFDLRNGEEEEESDNEESDENGVEEDRIVEVVESKSEEGGSVVGSLDKDFEEILQMEQNWGNSQSLFDPLHPFTD